jgi:serine/threonine-protein kinase
MLLGGKVSVPDVTGTELSSAKSSIISAGLTVGDVTEVPSSTVDKGKVISTDPEANAEVSKNTSVNIQVSSGPSQVEVPDVTNMSEEAAKRALESVGLKYKSAGTEYSSTVKEGNVIKQSITSGTTVDADTTVSCTISAGVDSVTVPDLAGLTETEAMAKLESLGLTGLVGSRQSSDTVASGTVISQNPAKNMKVDSGTQVTFTVSTGVATVSVPALEGLSQTAARSTLINAGLTLGNITEEYSSESKGTVIEQSVTQGTAVEKGSSVDVVISKGEDPSKNTNTNNSNYNTNNTNSNSTDEPDETF